VRRSVIKEGGTVFRRTESGFVTGGSEEVLVRDSKQSTNGLLQRESQYGLETIRETIRLGDGLLQTVTEFPDESQEITDLDHGRTLLTVRFDANEEEIGRTEFVYDAHNRLEETLSAEGILTIYQYNDADLPSSVSTEGENESALVTEYEYDELGRRTKTILPDQSEQTTQYTARGETAEISGAQTYPVSYTYDDQGRMVTMTTTRAAGPSVTTWA